MQFSTVAALSILSTGALAAFQNATTITTEITVTGYTTYCPEPTTLTLTVCDESKLCAPSQIVVTEAQTVTVTEECVVPTSYTTTDVTVTKTYTCTDAACKQPTQAPVVEESSSLAEESSSLAEESTTFSTAYVNITSYEGAGVRNAAGVAAGFAAIAAALM
ncbi:unnamed protein product [Candida verbasci]|uniref:Uncharacterized protein n=1 Tax=Candida verbasci TaxID=1227364 RepID=A0A9W4TWF3_9ASCO|nr:unnamed protein product [Candida verbasci]